MGKTLFKNLHLAAVLLAACLVLACSAENIADIKTASTYPSLVTIPGPTFDPIEWTRLIKLPASPGAYNPSIVRYQDGYLLSARFDTFPSDRNPIPHRRHDQILVMRLDSDFNPVGSLSRLEFKGLYDDRSKSQDARLFWYDSRLWMVFNSPSTVADGQQWMHLAEITETDGAFTVKSVQILQGRQEVEKNWSPFVADGSLYFVYSIHPQHTILRCDTSSGKLDEIARTPGFDWRFGQARGGTQALMYKGRFISVFHGSRDVRFLNGKRLRIYSVGAYTYAAKYPFAIEGYTPNAFDGEGLYDPVSNRRKILFPGGMVIEGDYAYVVSGVNDTAMILSKVNLAIVEQNLVKFDGTKE